jgi:hypothetical protein|tara:strand:+ start:87 stop:932 length:846 start_codon:yes stop_codon:yes gene_type:complete
MAAKFLVEEQEADLETEEASNTQETFESMEEEPAHEADSPEVEEEVSEEEEVVDPALQKYSGKSIPEVIKMHQEAEKHISRQGNELGDLRSVIDKYVKDGLAATTHKNNESKPKQDDIDILDKPDEYIQRSIENSDQAKELKEIKQALKQQDITTKLTDNHPDYLEVVNNEAFVSWVKGSKVRLELFERAHTGFDYDSANELLSNWKERQQVIKDSAQNEDASRKQQRKAASTGSATGSGEAKSRKLYRRSDIINLMRNDPNRYLELSDEITKAYAEKRVR